MTDRTSVLTELKNDFPKCDVVDMSHLKNFNDFADIGMNEDNENYDKLVFLYRNDYNDHFFDILMNGIEPELIFFLSYRGVFFSGTDYKRLSIEKWISAFHGDSAGCSICYSNATDITMLGCDVCSEYICEECKFSHLMRVVEVDNLVYVPSVKYKVRCPFCNHNGEGLGFV